MTKMDWSGFPTRDLEDTMFYVLYDLREDPSLSKIHLPAPDEDGPVLLLLNKKDYSDIYRELLEMTQNEGFNWFTSLIYKPMGSPIASDLLPDTPYILIAHVNLIKGSEEKFLDRISSMKVWRPN